MLDYFDSPLFFRTFQKFIESVEFIQKLLENVWYMKKALKCPYFLIFILRKKLTSSTNFVNLR